MIYAVLADIHGNDIALEAVIADAQKQGATGFICVGDIVGYGAEPGRCLERVRNLGCACVAGNHDRAIAGVGDLATFNSDAHASALWTRQRLSAEERDFLAGLPLTATVDSATIVHGSLQDPEQFNYILSLWDAVQTFRRMTQPLCFVGHSHVAGFFHLDDSVTYSVAEHLHLTAKGRVIVNAGSVGQPRDCDPRAAYALYDVGQKTVSLRRVTYDWEAAAQKILAAGLPEMNAYRLALGQ